MKKHTVGLTNSKQKCANSLTCNKIRRVGLCFVLQLCLIHCASQLKHAGRMQPITRRDAGVWHQTRSLLYKNLLIKWRTKQQSLQVPFICHSYAFFLHSKSVALLKRLYISSIWWHWAPSEVCTIFNRNDWNVHLNPGFLCILKSVNSHFHKSSS